MDDREKALREKLQRLVNEAAAAAVELDRANGTIQGVPHYSVIELRAHELGQQLSREIQRRQMAETVAGHSSVARCPTCGARCDAKPKRRSVKSIDGSIELMELEASCPFCRRAFFPSAGENGL
jgi:uncharacterized protein with PIN domain